MRAALLTLLLLAASPAAAMAAPPWSAPQDVSREHVTLSDPSLTGTGTGGWLAAWRWQDGLRHPERTGESVAARPRRAGAFGAERGLPASRVGDPMAYGAARAAIAVVRPPGSSRASRGQLRVAFGRASGRFGRSRLVARRAGIASPAFAGNDQGDLALAWFEDRGTSNDRVEVALRRAGRRFGHSLRLATGRIRSVTVAVGPRGDVLVAWDARGVVRARFKPAGRRRFGPTETIRSEPTYFARLEAAVARGGRAYLAWSAQFLSEGGSIGPVFVQAAMRPSRARRFQAAELLDRLDPEHAANPVDLAADPGSGRAILGWTGFDGATNRARVAETDPSGRFSVRQDLSAPGVDAVLGDVDRSATGSRVAVWTASFFPGVERQVQGAYAPVGAAFGSPEEISGRSADTPRVAFGRGTERPVAVWLGRTVGSSGASRTRLQAAARSG